MRRWLWLGLLLLLMACGARPYLMRPGDVLGSAYFIDAQTGDCVRISWNGTYRVGTYVVIERVSPINCQRRQ